MALVGGLLTLAALTLLAVDARRAAAQAGGACGHRSHAPGRREPSEGEHQRGDAACAHVDGGLAPFTLVGWLAALAFCEVR
ncbi:hypothetical protein NKG94_02915 [Micromonospora sp. M12]